MILNVHCKDGVFLQLFEGIYCSCLFSNKARIFFCLLMTLHAYVFVLVKFCVYRIFTCYVFDHNSSQQTFLEILVIFNSQCSHFGVCRSFKTRVMVSNIVLGCIIKVITLFYFSILYLTLQLFSFCVAAKRHGF